VVYNSPDRVDEYFVSDSPSETIAIGRTLYTQFGLGSSDWVRLGRTPPGYSSAYQDAMEYLSPLLDAQSVSRSGSTYVAEIVYANYPEASGQIVLTVVVRTDGPYVKEEIVEEQGIIPIDGPRVQTRRFEVSYSQIGTSPRVLAPNPLPAYGEAFCGPAATSGSSLCPA